MDARRSAASAQRRSRGLVVGLLLWTAAAPRVVGAGGASWLLVAAPASQPGATFETDLRLAAWNAVPGAIDLVRITHVCPAPGSAFFPECTADEASFQSGDTRIGCMQTTPSATWKDLRSFALVSWEVMQPGAGSTISVEPKQIVATRWDQIELQAYGATTGTDCTDGDACVDDGDPCTDDICSAGVCSHPAVAPRCGGQCGEPAQQCGPDDGVVFDALRIRHARLRWAQAGSSVLRSVTIQGAFAGSVSKPTGGVYAVAHTGSRGVIGCDAIPASAWRVDASGRSMRFVRRDQSPGLHRLSFQRKGKRTRFTARFLGGVLARAQSDITLAVEVVGQDERRVAGSARLRKPGKRVQVSR